MKTLIVSLLVISLTFASSEKDANSITSCKGNACPSYTVQETYSGGVEKRLYESFSTASYTSIPCLTWNAAQSQGYFHLSMYARNYANADRRTLKMGVPVLLEAKYTNDVDERCSHVYTTSFYINEETLPDPSNRMIKIKEVSDLNVYSYQFDGIVRDAKDKVLELRVKLNALGLCYDPSTYYTASYSSPSSLLNNKLEVWLPVKDCKSSHFD